MPFGNQQHLPSFGGARHVGFLQNPAGETGACPGIRHGKRKLIHGEVNDRNGQQSDSGQCETGGGQGKSESLQEMQTGKHFKEANLLNSRS